MNALTHFRYSGLVGGDEGVHFFEDLGVYVSNLTDVGLHLSIEVDRVLASLDTGLDLPLPLGDLISHHPDKLLKHEVVRKLASERLDLRLYTAESLLNLFVFILHLTQFSFNFAALRFICSL